MMSLNQRFMHELQTALWGDALVVIDGILGVQISYLRVECRKCGIGLLFVLNSNTDTTEGGVKIISMIRVKNKIL